MSIPTTPAQLSGASFSAAPRHVSPGALITRTLAVWRKNIFKFGLLAALMYSPVPIVGVVAAITIGVARHGTPRGGYYLDRLDSFLISCVDAPVVLALVAMHIGALTHGVVQHLIGRPVRLGGMLATGLRRALPLVGVGVLVVLMSLAGSLLLVLPGVMLACAAAVAIPALIVEKASPMAAIRRSWQLTRGHRVALFGACAVLVLVMFATDVLTRFAAPLLPSVAILIMLVRVLPYVLVVSIPALLPAIAYHELRLAVEGPAAEEVLAAFE